MFGKRVFDLDNPSSGHRIESLLDPSSELAQRVDERLIQIAKNVQFDLFKYPQHPLNTWALFTGALETQSGKPLDFTSPSFDAFDLVGRIHIQPGRIEALTGPLKNLPDNSPEKLCSYLFLGISFGHEVAHCVERMSILNACHRINRYRTPTYLNLARRLQEASLLGNEKAEAGFAMECLFFGGLVQPPSFADWESKSGLRQSSWPVRGTSRPVPMLYVSRMQDRRFWEMIEPYPELDMLHVPSLAADWVDDALTADYSSDPTEG